jgi:hypothetical protein
MRKKEKGRRWKRTPASRPCSPTPATPSTRATRRTRPAEVLFLLLFFVIENLAKMSTKLWKKYMEIYKKKIFNLFCGLSGIVWILFTKPHKNPYKIMEICKLCIFKSCSKWCKFINLFYGFRGIIFLVLLGKPHENEAKIMEICKLLYIIYKFIIVWLLVYFS